MLKIDKLYHVPLKKVHLAFFNDYGLLVTVCGDFEIEMCDYDGWRPMGRGHAEYWDSFNQPVTCKRCLRWRGL